MSSLHTGAARRLLPRDMTGGFTMLEVMVAVIVLGLLTAPLVTSSLSAVGAAHRARLRDGYLAAMAAASGGGEAWEWGSRVESARWQPGPVLDVTVGSMVEAEGPAVLVGVWTDGWFLGEHSPESDGLCRIAASEWREGMGREVVIRVREVQEMWGPPWRTIVPDRAAEDPTVAEIDPIGIHGARRLAEEWTAAHAPALANPTVRPGVDGPPVEVDPLGLVLFMNPAGSGRRDLSVGPEEVEGNVQSWYEEDGRAHDVYF